MNQLTTINSEQVRALSDDVAVAKAHVRARLVFLLVCVDIIALLAGGMLGSRIRYGELSWSGETISLIAAAIPLYLLSGFAAHAFSGSALIGMASSIRRAFTGGLGATGLLLLVLFALQQSNEVSRLQFALATLFSLLFLASGRVLVVNHARRALKGRLYSIIRVVDDRADGASIHMQDDMVPPIRLKWDIRMQNPAGYHELAQMLKGTDRVIVQCPTERRVQWAHILQGMNVHAEVVASELRDIGVVGVGSHDDEPTLVVARGPLDLWGRLIKRIFDLALATSALMLLLPLMLLTALAIRIDSSGPVFFKQTRIGRQNRLFNIVKFRSMRHERSDAGGQRSAARDDDRITRVGRVIRKLSVDELPQLLNVLAGDMSIVGPRPHALQSMAQNKLFWEVDQRYWHRHACKPGITGLAQVRGHRGATVSEKHLTDRLAADLEYLANWSIWLDLSILVRTIGVIVHRNAF